MKFKSLNIPDVFEISPNIIKDSRGYFFELFRVSEFKKKIGNFSFVQENESYSKKHTLRGLHLQLSKKQGKLVTVRAGPTPPTITSSLEDPPEPLQCKHSLGNLRK